MKKLITICLLSFACIALCRTRSESNSLRSNIGSLRSDIESQGAVISSQEAVISSQEAEIELLEEKVQHYQKELVQNNPVNVVVEVEEDTASYLMCDYVLNTSTYKFHLPTCRMVRQMDDKNKKFVEGDRSEIINDGYSPCGICDP